MSPIDIFADYFMGFLASSLCVAVIYFLRRKFFDVGILSLKGLIFVYGLCIFRAAFPLELPWAVSVRFQILVPITDLLFFMPIAYNGMEIYGWQIALCIYAMLVFAFSIRLISYYIKAANIVKRAQIITDNCIVDLFKKVVDENKHSINIKLLVSPDIDSPISLGLFKSSILLPEKFSDMYSDKEIYHILKHEYIHVVKHDTVSKLMINIASCFVFWNPCMRLLKKDYIQSIELRCDKEATSGYTSEIKCEYLSTMLSVLKNKAKKYVDSSSYEPALNFVSNGSVYIKERFISISNSGNPLNQKKNKTIPIIVVALFLCSYFFILHAQYDPPIEDIIEGPDCFEIDFDKDYILILEDGSATLYLKDGTQIVATEEIIDCYIKNEGKVFYE